ncbi:hypothetical protein NPIL_535401 [Nephila pilipes]|uniref:Uncharacterized protein n=1 Tax=Nephila pilipes TaxID=299642 RepID=A0A8X6PF13_NEPPI|nr:hypothetical protein NPIL_535401 [Nephila pilipes]
MPQRLQCKRVWKGMVEKNNYTFSYPLGKEPPSEFVQLCQNLVLETFPATKTIGSVFTLAYLLCRNGTVSEPCHKYPSTTFVREQILGDGICRSRNITLIRTDKKAFKLFQAK